MKFVADANLFREAKMRLRGLYNANSHCHPKTIFAAISLNE